jgi:hypothetical protein
LRAGELGAAGLVESVGGALPPPESLLVVVGRLIAQSQPAHTGAASQRLRIWLLHLSGCAENCAIHMTAGSMSSEDDKRAEAEIEIWKIKKLIKNLEAARG